jgi:hypothetical protein
MIKEIEISGRKYIADVSEDEQEGAYVIISPPEGLVDERKVFTYRDVSKPGVAQGILQELLSIDGQKIAEIFSQFERESL